MSFYYNNIHNLKKSQIVEQYDHLNDSIIRYFTELKKHYSEILTFHKEIFDACIDSKIYSDDVEKLIEASTNINNYNIFEINYNKKSLNINELGYDMGVKFNELNDSTHGMQNYDLCFITNTMSFKGILLDVYRLLYKKDNDVNCDSVIKELSTIKYLINERIENDKKWCEEHNQSHFLK